MEDRKAAFDRRRRTKLCRSAAAAMRETLPDSRLLDCVESMEDPDTDSPILIEIPSYRDTQLLPTIRSALGQALNPDRVHFAVCLQDDDPEILRQLQQIPNCRVKHIPEADAPGLCAARLECQKLAAGEPWVLHIDSHARFSGFWDVILIDEWKSCRDRKALLTGYAPNAAKYIDEEPDSDVFTKDAPAGIVSLVHAAWYSEPAGMMRCGSRKVIKRDSCVKGAWIGGHFLFGPSLLDREVPSDPEMYFTADEASMSIRYWTWGWQAYHPWLRPVWHIYGRVDACGRPVQRFPDRKPGAPSPQAREKKRMEQLMAGRVPAPFGLGTVRTLESFLEWSGLHESGRYVRAFGSGGLFDAPHTEDDLRWISPPRDPKKPEISEQDQKNLESLNFPEHFRALQKKPDGTCRSPYMQHLLHLGDPDFSSVILIQITCRFDPDMENTVRSALEQAACPARIQIAAACQTGSPELERYLASLPRCSAVWWSTEKGAVPEAAMRLQLEKLDTPRYDFILRVSSHTRFAKWWDLALTDRWRACGDEKAVLTALPPDCGPRAADGPCAPSLTDGLPMGSASIVRAGAFDPASRTFTAGTARSLPAQAPVPGVFLHPAMIFAPAAFARELPADPEIRAGNPELPLAARAWTRGWNIFHPDITPLWSAEGAVPSRILPAPDPAGTARRMDTFWNRPASLPPRFRPGRVRSIRDWLALAGLDPASGTVSLFAREGRFDAARGAWDTSAAPGPDPDRICAFRRRLTAAREMLPRCTPLDWLAALPDSALDLESPVLVEIPAWNEPDLLLTLEAARCQAAAPERIAFAVCLQDPDPAMTRALQAMPDVRLVTVPKEKALGSAQARNLCQGCLRDTDRYVLHTDAHMRFAAFWDVTLLELLRRCGDPDALLTGVPPGFESLFTAPVSAPAFTRDQAFMQTSLIHPFRFHPETGVLLCRGTGFIRTDAPVPSPFLCHAMVFGPTEMDRRVPLDPGMYCAGDSVPWAARLWTWGFRIFLAPSVPLWHLYGRRNFLPEALRQRGTAVPGTAPARSEHERNRALFAGELPETDFGPGPVRTLASWLDFAGVDMAGRRVRRFALDGRFDLPPTLNDSAWMQIP